MIFKEFERLCDLIVTDQDITLLTNSIENKLLRANFNSPQSNMRSFLNKPLQATTFSNVTMLLETENSGRFANVIVKQCKEMLAYSRKLNSDSRLEENKATMDSLTRIGATNQVSFIPLI